MGLIRHRSVQASAATGVTLALCSTIRPLPWWLWAAWSVLSVVGFRQAVRDH